MTYAERICALHRVRALALVLVGGLFWRAVTVMTGWCNRLCLS